MNQTVYFHMLIPFLLTTSLSRTIKVLPHEQMAGFCAVLIRINYYTIISYFFTVSLVLVP